MVTNWLVLFILQGVVLAQMFNPHLPEHVHEAMIGVESRRAMNRLVRLLFQAEELANQTRGWYYLHDRNQFPSLRAVLNARSDYVLSVEALAVPQTAVGA